MSEKKLPLAGVRVVEFVHMVMGPTCGLVLADLGAEVIKIEPIDGDHTRHLTASGAGFFPTYNRNKKSLAVDLKSAAGREIVLKLIKTADVISENFRPGAMEKLGFGYAAAKKLNVSLPIILRLEGTNVEEGRKIINESGISIISADTLTEAAQKAVAACRGAHQYSLFIRENNFEPVYFELTGISWGFFYAIFPQEILNPLVKIEHIFLRKSIIE